MVKVNELKELLFKAGLYNVSKLNDFNFEISGEQEYLEHILKLELKLRQENSEKEHRRKSNLPELVVDKKYSGIEEWNMNELLKLDWIEKCSNVILIGKCGTGKTIAATKIGNKALEKGYKVFYTKVESFISMLRTKETLPRSKRTFEYLKQCDLIIIDDMMYIPLSEVELVMMYKAIMFLNESRSLMFITNRRLDEWRDAQEGSHTIETLVDRILTYSKIITFK